MFESFLLATSLRWQMPTINFKQKEAIVQPVKEKQRINLKGLNLVKQFEGLYLKPYLCPSGVRTIG